MFEKSPTQPSHTGKVSYAFVGTVMLALGGIIPFNPQPLPRLIFDGTYIAYSASFGLEGKPLANVMGHAENP